MQNNQIQFNKQVYTDKLYTASIVELYKRTFCRVYYTLHKERAVCDAVIHRKKMDVQMFQTAMKEYMSDSSRRLQVLVRYAEKLGIRDEVMKYVEVLA